MPGFVALDAHFHHKVNIIFQIARKKGVYLWHYMIRNIRDPKGCYGVWGQASYEGLELGYMEYVCICMALLCNS